MPIIETNNSEVKTLAGLTLFHSGLSSCSQRARMILAEKGLDWNSRVIDLPGGEHASPEYLSINPNGIVPTLVHDGQVIIESIDIIDYLNDNFADPPLRPVDPQKRTEMYASMARADAAQSSLKLLSHEFLFKPGKRSNDELEAFLAGHQNEVLKQFHRDYQSPEGFGDARIRDMAALQDARFGELDLLLSDGDWLFGGQFSLADIAWIPNVYRMNLMDYPLDERHPNLSRWYARIKDRPSFQSAIIDWHPQPMLDGFAAYTAKRTQSGSDVIHFLG